MLYTRTLNSDIPKIKSNFEQIQATRELLTCAFTSNKIKATPCDFFRFSPIINDFDDICTT